MRWRLPSIVVVLGVGLGLAIFLGRELGSAPATSREAGAAVGGSPNARLGGNRTSDPRQPAAVTTALSASTSAPAAKITTINPIERRRIQAAIREARASSKLPAAQPTPARSTEAPPTDLTPEQIAARRTEVRKQITEVAPLLAECYELEVAKQPELAGSLRLRFTIDGEPGVGGIVSESQVVGGTLAEQPDLATCITETIYTVKFAPPEAGGTIEVEYPFVFGQGLK